MQVSDRMPCSPFSGLFPTNQLFLIENLDEGIPIKRFMGCSAEKLKIEMIVRRTK